MSAETARQQLDKTSQDYVALQADLEKMQGLLQRHQEQETSLKAKTRAGERSLDDLVAAQARRLSVEGIIAEIEAELAATEASLLDLEQQHDREKKHEHLAALAAKQAELKKQHETALLDLENTVAPRVTAILDTELAWADLHAEGLAALEQLGFSNELSPSATAQAKDAALLAEVEKRGVSLSALLAPRHTRGTPSWAHRPYKPPVDTKSALGRAVLNTIQAAREDRHPKEQK